MNWSGSGLVSIETVCLYKTFGNHSNAHACQHVGEGGNGTKRLFFILAVLVKSLFIKCLSSWSNVNVTHSESCTEERNCTTLQCKEGMITRLLIYS